MRSLWTPDCCFREEARNSEYKVNTSNHSGGSGTPKVKPNYSGFIRRFQLRDSASHLRMDAMGDQTRQPNQEPGGRRGACDGASEAAVVPHAQRGEEVAGALRPLRCCHVDVAAQYGASAWLVCKPHARVLSAGWYLGAENETPAGVVHLVRGRLPAVAAGVVGCREVRMGDAAPYPEHCDASSEAMLRRRRTRLRLPRVAARVRLVAGDDGGTYE